MAVYNLAGNQLNSIYSQAQDELDFGFGVDGSIVYERKYSIDNVVSYCRDRTLSVCEEIKALSDAWQSFVFITDTHGNGNKQHSQAIGLYLLDNAPVSMLVLGGDYSLNNWSKTEYDIYVTPLKNSGMTEKIYAIFGNHETKGDGTAEAKQSIYNDFLKDKTNLVGELADNYYLFDDSTRKIRYIFLNTSDGSNQYQMSSEQLAWIAEKVVLPDSTWSLVVFGHVTLNNMGVPTYSNESNGSAVVSAITSNCNGEIVGYICGHQHIDTVYYDGNIYHVTLQCDKFENVDYYSGVSVTDRVSETITELAVSVVSFNTTTKQVVIRRIGAGRNQTMSYSYASREAVE